MTRRPHILIFNPDQWHGDVLGHVGNPGAATPHLDQVVQNDGINDPSMAGILARLRERLLTFYLESCDVVPHDADQRG